MLDELNELLLVERDALRKLDAGTVSDVASRKLEVNRALGELLRVATPNSEDVKRVQRVLEQLKLNQILLVHAKSAVRRAIEAATGRPVCELPSTRPPPAMTVRLDVRG